MKRFFALLLALVLASSMVISVYADMSGPDPIVLDVTIIGRDVPVYDTDYDSDTQKSYGVETGEIIKEGTVVQVYSSQCYPCDDGYDYICLTGGHAGYLRMDDSLSIADYTPKYMRYLKCFPEIKLQVINSDGVKLRKGPSIAYDAITTIPYGETVTFTYTESDWAYTTYKGQSGWVRFWTEYNSPSDGVAMVTAEPTKLMVVKDNTPLQNLDEVYFREDEEDTRPRIPKGTKFTSSLFCTYAHDEKEYIVKYKNHQGYLYFNKYFEDEGVALQLKNKKLYFMSDQSVTLYKWPGEKQEVCTLSLSKYEELTPDYICTIKNEDSDSDVISDNWFRVKIGNKTGWFKPAEDSFLLSYSEGDYYAYHSFREPYMNFEDCVMYTDFDSSETTGTILPAYTEFHVIYGEEDHISSRYCVQYEGKTGWIEKTKANKAEWNEYAEVRTFNTGSKLYSKPSEQKEDVLFELPEKMNLVYDCNCYQPETDDSEEKLWFRVYVSGTPVWVWREDYVEIEKELPISNDYIYLTEDDVWTYDSNRDLDAYYAAVDAQAASEKKAKEVKNSVRIVVLCVASALALALTAVVVLRLAKRKKNKETEDTEQE